MFKFTQSLMSWIAARTSSRSARICSSVTRIVLVLGAATSIVAISAAPAGAYTTYNYGYTGAVSVPAFVSGGADATNDTAYVVFGGGRVWKAAAYSGYNQYVCVKFNVFYAAEARVGLVADAWQPWSTETTCGWISGFGVSAGFNADGIHVTRMSEAYGGWLVYGATIEVTWQLGNGTLIGRRIFDYNTVSDYRCLTSWCWIKTSGGEAYLEL